MCYLYVSSCRLYCREWLNTNELAAYPAHGGLVNPPMHTLVCRFVAALNLASTWESGLGALSAYDHNLELPTQVIQGAGYRTLLGPDGGQNAECVRTEAGSVGGSVIGMLDGNQFQKQPEDKIKIRFYYNIKYWIRRDSLKCRETEATENCPSVPYMFYNTSKFFRLAKISLHSDSGNGRPMRFQLLGSWQGRDNCHSGRFLRKRKKSIGGGRSQW